MYYILPMDGDKKARQPGGEALYDILSGLKVTS